jgi:phospholipase/carboxylesterase
MTPRDTHDTHDTHDTVDAETTRRLGMRDAKFGGLWTHLTGGRDREGGGDGPLVVLMHGFGAPGTDLVGLWRVLRVPSGTRFAFPEAPLTLPEYGSEARAWWQIDITRFQRPLSAAELEARTREAPPGLDAARTHVIAALDALQEQLGVSSSQIVLGGFSQGSMLACEVALADPRPFAGLALLSSTLIHADAWLANLPARRGLPVFQSHGQDDPILPFALAELLRDHLVQAGLEVDWLPFRGGHEIPGSVLDRLGAFVSRVVG